MKRIAVMIIHGFMSNQKEVEYLKNSLNNISNFDVFTFTLPGHEDYNFKDINYKDWIDYSEKVLKDLKMRYNDIYIIGHSMGGVIASHLASTNREIKKLVLVAPSFKYLEIFDNPKILKEKINETIRNRKKYKSLTQRILNSSVKSVIEFRKLVKKYQNCPNNIECEVLIMHGEKDIVVPIKSSEEIFNTINSNKKYFKIISEADHSMIYDYKKEKVAGYICNYLKGGLLWIITRDLKI